MKILAITTGQGQRKDQCLGQQHLRAGLSPDSALAIPIRQVCWEGRSTIFPHSHPVRSELQSPTQSGWDRVGLDLMNRKDTEQLAFPTLGRYCREEF